jgi:membrane fusion protein (multidrug efflux system)
MTRRGLPAKLAFWAVIVVAALGGVGGLWYVRGQAGAKTVAAQGPGADGPPAVPVEMGPVEIGTVINDVTVVGSLRSNEAVIIRPEIAGRITEINIAEGDRIAKDALLFRLDDAIYRAELAEAEASFNLSRQNYQRARELYGRGAGTERARDEAFAKLEIDRASVELKKTRLSKTRIEAPFQGIVGLRKVSVGDYVQVGQDLVNLEDIDPVKADFRIPERHLGIVKDGQKVRIEVDAYPGRVFEGAVYAIDPQIDVATRSLGVRARLPNPERLLRPGLFARITLLVEERRNAVIVPEQALMPRGNDRFVFKVMNGKAMLTKVEIGLRRAGKVEITRGLSAGDVIVTAGHLKIQDGVPVQAPVAVPKS